MPSVTRIDLRANPLGLLRLELPQGCTTISFDDDIGGVAKEGIQLDDFMNTALIDSIANWLDNCGLQLKAEKTEAMMLTGKWAFQVPRIIVHDHKIEIKKSLRYLGLKLGTKLKFGTHINKIAGKTTAGNYIYDKRKLIFTAVNSILLTN